MLCLLKEGARGNPTLRPFPDAQGNLTLRSSAKAQNVRKNPHQKQFGGFVHKPTAIKEAMKISETKAAVDKEWDKLKNFPAWDFNKVQPKTEVVRQAKNDGRAIHLASLMDLCHLWPAEVAEHLKPSWLKLGIVAMGPRVASFAFWCDACEVSPRFRRLSCVSAVFTALALLCV